MMTMNKKIITYVLLVALIAIPLTGCFGRAPANIPPTCDFTYSPSAPTTDDNVQFTDKSTDADGTVVGRTWDFGDGGTSTAQNPSHTFDDAGAFAVTLTAEDDDGALATCSTTVTVIETAPPAEIELEDAIDILMGEILKPADSDDRVSAFMLSQPLQTGDVITSESGLRGLVEGGATWFAFIDYEPEAAFAHDTGYVTIDVDDGEYEVIDDTWPPEINDVSMWDIANLNRGQMINIYPILDSAVPIVGTRSDAPTADYGDAPDGQDAYYGVQGRFPTLYNTANSHFSRPGGHTLNIGEETIGFNVSPEVDANDLNDPDLVPNLVDADSDERVYVIASGGKARLAVTVTVSAGAPDVTRYINALIDLDQSGKWSASTYAKEWVVINLPVDVDPGTSRTIITPEFYWGIQSVPPPPVWMRVALTREQVDETLFTNVGGWDGSGQFEYGEIEDYFTFLTDNPPLPEWVPVWPPVWPPDGEPPDGGAPPPGPEEGPCGYDINYYVIIINGGDHAKHINQGIPIMRASAARMTDVAKDQGYTSVANLGPGGNSVNDISKAIKDLASKVKCGDHVLIYIAGHGYESGGIAMKNASGSTKDKLTPKVLKDLLDTIPACPDEDCETPNKSCYVSVVIESCYAGNFKNIAGQGRAVMGAADNQPCWLYSDGGVFTKGFDQDLRNPASDKSVPPDGVDPTEAYGSAEARVKKFNNDQGKDQKPWKNNQWCECKCGECEPDIIVEKWIFDDITGEWVDELEASMGQWVEFLIEIESSGECRDIVDIVLIDYLPYCLSYGGEAMLYYGDEAYPREPCEITEGEYGLELTWNLGEDIPQLPPEAIVEIEYWAWPVYPGENLNEVYGEARCAVDRSVIVSDEASAAVWVTETE